MGVNFRIWLKYGTLIHVSPFLEAERRARDDAQTAAAAAVAEESAKREVAEAGLAVAERTLDRLVSLSQTLLSQYAPPTSK